MKNKKNILKNLKSSDLGFKTPDNYFENFKSTVCNSKAIDIEKNEGFAVPNLYFEKLDAKILSKLDSSEIPKKTGFTTPKNYFENFEINSINISPENKVINLLSNQYKKFISMAVAASLLLFIGINYFANHQKTINLDDLTANEIENWMDDNLIGLNSYDIAEVYKEIDINNNSLYFEDEISDYLEEEDLEIMFLEN